MKNKHFTNVTFWAREYKLPLFFQTLINKNKNILAFYKNSVIHAYYLNNTEKKLGIQGYRFFSDENKIVRYKRQVKKILKQIKNITGMFAKTKVKFLNRENIEPKNIKY